MYRIYLITEARRHYELVNLASIIYGDNNNTWCDRQSLRGLNILLARLRRFNYRCRCDSDIEDLTQSQTASGSAVRLKGPPFGCIQTISSRALFNLTRTEQLRLGRAIAPIMLLLACICRTHKIHFIFVTLIWVLCLNDARTVQLALFLRDAAVPRRLPKCMTSLRTLECPGAKCTRHFCTTWFQLFTHSLLGHDPFSTL